MPYINMIPAPYMIISLYPTLCFHSTYIITYHHAKYYIIYNFIVSIRCLLSLEYVFLKARDLYLVPLIYTNSLEQCLVL